MLANLLSRRRVIFGLVAATLCLAIAEKASADPPYVRIEEDWELILNTPDISFPTPQLVVQMKPGPSSPKSALFLINHHDHPSFNVGGGQIQLWDGGMLRSYKSFTGPTLINEGEHVTWTQYLQRNGAHITFGLNRVDGDAWGTNTAATLGGPIAWADPQVAFWNYDSNESVKDATITFGPERVELFRIVEVRKYKVWAGEGSILNVWDTEGPKVIWQGE